MKINPVTSFQCLGYRGCFGCFGTVVIEEVHSFLAVPQCLCVPGRVTVVCSEAQSSDTPHLSLQASFQGDILPAVQPMVSCFECVPIPCTQGIQPVFHLYFRNCFF